MDQQTPTTEVSTFSGARRILNSLLLGLPVPVLFAFYSLSLADMKAVSVQTVGLATLQICWMATTLTAVVGAALALSDGRTRGAIVGLFKHHWRDLVWVNLFTLLGPPLYIYAVIKLGAGPANWIDLGMTPLLTFAAAFWVRDGRVGRNALELTGVACAVLGIALVMWRLGSGRSEPGNQMWGVLASVVSAIGTAGSGVVIARIQRDRNWAVPDAALLAGRYVLAIAALSISCIAMADFSQILTPAFEYPALGFVSILLVLYVLPNYVYVLVVKKKGLLFSGYLWALLPLCVSLLELASGKSSLGWPITLVVAILIVGGLALSEFRAAPVSARGQGPQ